MTNTLTWTYQGRQEHGHFGHGTAPPSDTDPPDDHDLFRPANAADRVDYILSGLIGHVPRNDRSRWTPALDAAARTALKTAFAAWYGASSLSRDAFRTRFLNPYTSDAVVDSLRAAAKGAIEARSYDDLAQAGRRLADAAGDIGPDAWPLVMWDASQDATLAVSNGEVPGVVKASAAGTDYGTVFVLGLLAVLAYMVGSRPSSAPSSKPTVMTHDGTTPSQSEQPANADSRNSPQKAKVFDDRRRHILGGDPDGGGGHRPGTGRPGKSEFPAGWSDDRIIDTIEDVANDPSSQRKTTGSGRIVVTGSRDGLDIRVVVEPDGERIVTGYPTNVPRNPKR